MWSDRSQRLQINIKISSQLLKKFITGIKISPSEDSIPPGSNMRSARFSPPKKMYASMIAGLSRQTDCQSCVRQLLESVFLLSTSFHPNHWNKVEHTSKKEKVYRWDCDSSTKNIWYLCSITLIKSLQEIMQLRNGWICPK